MKNKGKSIYIVAIKSVEQLEFESSIWKQKNWGQRERFCNENSNGKGKAVFL